MLRIVYTAVLFVVVLVALSTQAVQPVAIAQKGGVLVQTAVVGIDKSVDRAMNAARRSAQDVARGSYRLISSRTVRTGDTLYTCTMVIEYRTR